MSDEIDQMVDDMFGMGNDGLGALDPDELEALVEGGDLAGFVRRVLPGASRGQQQAAATVMQRRMDANTTLIGSAAAQFFARQATQPNASATLHPALTSGTFTAVANNTAVALVDIMTGQPFQFQQGMVFYGMLVDSVDANQGFHFAGGTVKFASDIAPSMQTHVAFAPFTEDIQDPTRIPLGVYRGRRFNTTTAFNASVIQFSGGPLTMKQGVTLNYYDNRIRAACSCFTETPQPNQFGALARSFVDRVRSRIRRPNAAEVPDPIRIPY